MFIIYLFLEMPNLMNSNDLQAFRMWDRELVSLQHLKLTRINKRTIESALNKDNNVSVDK